MGSKQVNGEAATEEVELQELWVRANGLKQSKQMPIKKPLVTGS